MVRSGQGAVAIAGVSETPENGAQVEATIEAILDLGQVASGVLGEGERMVGAGDRGLEVAEDRIHPTEFRMLNGGATRTDDDAVVAGPRGGRIGTRLNFLQARIAAHGALERLLQCDNAVGAADGLAEGEAVHSEGTAADERQAS